MAAESFITQKGSTFPARVHLKLQFTDDTMLTVSLTGMGVIQALKDDELANSYVYKRDFSATISQLLDELVPFGWTEKLDVFSKFISTRC